MRISAPSRCTEASPRGMLDQRALDLERPDAMAGGGDGVVIAANEGETPIGFVVEQIALRL